MNAALWPEVIGRLLRREDLPDDLVEQAMSEILSGDATDAQIAAFGVALRAKGETAAELAALVRTMLDFAEHVDLNDLGVPLVDTCGTGGDGAGTVNVSTMAAIVTAASGARVAKHGGRAASSKCGSVDVLESLPVEVDDFACDEPLLDLSLLLPCDVDAVVVVFFDEPAFADLPDVVDGPDFGACVVVPPAFGATEVVACGAFGAPAPLP